MTSIRCRKQNFVLTLGKGNYTRDLTVVFCTRRGGETISHTGTHICNIGRQLAESC